MELDGTPDAAQYEWVAAAYARSSAAAPCNELYERPAMRAAIGDPTGLRVLELGCGAGFLARWLVERGADVTALDASIGLVSHASRLCDRSGFIAADLNVGLPLRKGAQFDLVVSSLVVHYVQDLSALMRECRGSLRSGGRIVLSTHHPTAGILRFDIDDYFGQPKLQDLWRVEDLEFRVEYFHRSLTALVDAILGAGLLLDRIWEPQPEPSLAVVAPELFASLSTRPRHLFLAAHRP